MNIRVLLFSHVRHAIGVPELTVPLEPGATIEALATEIRKRAEGKLDKIPLAYAVNQEYVDTEHVLADGDEVALIPPVQGG